MKTEDNQPPVNSDYQVYLLRLQRSRQTNRWYISLQPAEETKQRVFANLNNLALYLKRRMNGEQ